MLRFESIFRKFKTWKTMYASVSSVAQSCLTLCSARLLCPWDSPGKNTFVPEVAFVLESRKEVAEKCFGMSPFIESSKRAKQYICV